MLGHSKVQDLQGGINQVSCYLRMGTESTLPWPDSSSNGSSSGSTSTSKPSTGLLSFLTSWRRNSTNGNKKNYGKNLFLDPRMHNPDYEDGFEMHQFSDSGRIANRYDNMRWDVW